MSAAGSSSVSRGTASSPSSGSSSRRCSPAPAAPIAGFWSAGIEFEDLARSVRQDGIEPTLEKLHDKGVYVTLEEFKGRRAIERGGMRRPAHPKDFDNPLLSRHFEARTGGSRGVGTRVLVDLDLLEHEAAYYSIFHSALRRERAARSAVVPSAPGRRRHEAGAPARQARRPSHPMVLAEPSRADAGDGALRRLHPLHDLHEPAPRPSAASAPVCASGPSLGGGRMAGGTAPAGMSRGARGRGQLGGAGVCGGAGARPGHLRHILPHQRRALHGGQGQDHRRQRMHGGLALFHGRDRHHRGGLRGAHRGR
jgi:hypothetical protein